jgi:hypothetical protein
LWEVYVLEEDIEHRGAGGAPREVVALAAPPAAAERAVWTHRMDEDFPEDFASQGAPLDEIALQGTFNAARFREQWKPILGRTFESLRPGGAVLAHVLTANRPLERMSELPGPASRVGYVPTEREVLDALAEAGFVGLRLTKFGESPCFVLGGVELRETMLRAWKPAPQGEPVGRILYKGPFAQVADEQGNIYRRGQWMTVDRTIWNRLRESADPDQFLFVEDI